MLTDGGFSLNMRDTDVTLVLQFHCVQTSLGCGQILERSIQWHKARPQQGLLSRPLLPIFLYVLQWTGQVVEYKH